MKPVATVLAFKMETGVRDAHAVLPAGFLPAPGFVAEVKRREVSVAPSLGKNCLWSQQALPAAWGKGSGPVLCPPE